ncbi:MAG TPA: hypothetical protein DCE42_16480 [Myxococcales bacterium]|nr:hypothetical protein [Deltaproteobacteria bacterium]HAA56363.1 hypothetical protein [Myxococcales bacterium]
MAEMGSCDNCGKRSNLTYYCTSCGDRICTTCRTKAGQKGKCPRCGKAASIKAN